MQSLLIEALTSVTSYPPGAGLFISHGIGRHVTRRFPEGEHELIFVRSGRLYIREDDENFDVGPDEALVLWPGRLHAGTADYDEDLQFYWLHFHYAALDLEPDNGRQEALQVPKHCHVSRPHVLEMYFRRYLHDAAETSLTPLAASSLVTLMLIELATESAQSQPSSSPNIIAGRAFAYIQSHLHQPLTTSMLADEMNCSSGYLSRAFRTVYGRTVTDVIHIERILHAQKLLLITNLDVDTVAAESGFSNTSYFIKLFKRHSGVTPLAYRKLHARMYVNMEFEKVS